jgi:hypothetical protein
MFSGMRGVPGGRRVDVLALAVEVAFVFEVGLDERPDVVGELGEQVSGSFPPGVFAAAEPLVELHAFVGRLADPGLGGAVHGGLFFLRTRRTRSPPGEADGGGARGEAEVGVVLAEEQAVFGAAGEHAVGFGAALGDEVVDHHAEVGLVAAEDEFRFSQHLEGGVGPGERPWPAASS